MTTTSSVSSSSAAPAAPTVNVGKAEDVSGLTTGSVNLSLAEAVTTKVQPYLDQATAVQTEINTNQTQIAAYQNLQSLLQSLQSSVADLTSEPLEGTNAFTSRVANLTSNSSIQASTILSATVANGTATGSHTITVNQLATAESDTSATLNLSSTASVSTLPGGVWPGDGTVTIAESGKTAPVAISITSSNSLSDIAAAINGASSTNGVTASVVTVDSSHQVLVLTGQDPDQHLNFTDSANPGILQYLGLISSTITGSNANPTTTAGSFTINSGGQTANVTVNAGDSLATIAANINSAAAGTNIVASVTADNRLQIEGNGNNPVNFSAVTGTALSSLGLAVSGAVNQGTPPQAALLTVDGVSGITRTSNTITDLLSGVTLNLAQAAPSTQVTLQIAPDTNGATTAINNFVTAYNSLQSFVAQNEATDSSGNAAAGAVLFGNATLREASLAVSNPVTESILGNSLTGLGISLNSSNQLVVDTATLSQSLSSNFSSVANFFQNSVTTSSTNLQPSSTNFSNFSGSFTLGITASAGNITGLTVNGASAAGKFTFSGNTISGVSGGPYAGLYFTYSGNGDTVTVNSTQGAATQIFTAAGNYGDPNTGQIQYLISEDQSEDTSYTSQYNDLVNSANDYTNFLVTQYSSLTTQIQNAGQTLSTLNALFTAQYSSNG